MGVPVCTSTGTQDYPLAAPDGAGGIFIAWRDFRNDQYADLYLQRVTAAGMPAPGWPTNGLPLAVAGLTQDTHAMTADGLGGVIVVWQDARDVLSTGLDIYALRVLDSGELAPGWPPNGLPVCRAPEGQDLPVVVGDGAGGAVVAWEDFRDGSWYDFVNPDIYAVRVTADGKVAAGWVTDGVAVANMANSYEVSPQLVASGDGGAIVVYRREGGAYAQRLTAGGTPDPAWPLGAALLSAPPSMPRLDGIQPVCGDGAGGAFVAWTDFRNYPGFGVTLPWLDIYAQHVTVGGQIASGWPADGLPVCTEFYGQLGTTITPDGHGGFLAAWNDYRTYEGEIYALRISGFGVLPPGWTVGGKRVSDLPGAEFKQAIAADGAGGAYIAFENEADPGPWKVHAQHLTGTGTIAAGWPAGGTPLSSLSQDEFLPSLANSPFGAIAVWTGGPGYDIYAQKLVVDGIVPLLISLVSTEAQADEVVLRWYAATGLRATITVWRRATTENWRGIGTVHSDGSGHIEYRDRDVLAGTRYGYRLSYTEDGTVGTTPEVWVDVPTNLALDLEGFRPNPSQGSPVAWFTLSTDEAATLELFDSAGRRRSAEEVGPLGAGRHALRLDDDHLAPGVYWLRLRQGAKTLTRRGVVVN